MLTPIKRFLAPPAFPDDEDKTRAALILNTFLLGTMGLLIVFTLAIPLVIVEKLYNAILILVLFSIVAATWWMMRRGHVRLAGMIYVSALWIIITGFISLAGGMTSIVNVFYLAITVVVGLMLGTRAALVCAVAGSLAGLGMNLMEASGHPLPRVFPVLAPVGWLDMTLALVLTALALHLTLRSLNDALVRARQEIEERKKAESQKEAALEVLRESEGRFRALVQNSSDVITILEADGTIRYQSPAAERVLGFTPEQRIGRNMIEFLDPEDVSRIPQALGELLHVPGSVIRIELALQHRDGSKRILEAIGINLLDAPTVRGIVTNSRDVTEQKRAEQSLREERDRVQKYLDVAGVMFVAIDADQCISLINRRGCEILGYEEAEIVGRNWFDTCVPERLKDAVKDVFDQLMAGEGEPVKYYENPVVTRRGEEHIIAWHNTLLTDEAGVPIGTLSSGEDITERRRAEEEVRQRAETLAALHETALDLAAQRALPDLLQAIVARAVDLLQAQGGGIYLYRPATDDLEFVLAYNLEPDFTGAVLKRGEGLSGQVLETGQSLAVADYSQWAGHSPQYEQADFAATVAVPISWGNRLLGVLDVLDDAPRTFSPADIALLERFAPLAAAVLENARLLQAEREQRQMAETLRQVARTLSTSLDQEQVLQLILEQLAWVVDYDSASVMLISGNDLDIVAHRGLRSKNQLFTPLRIGDLPIIAEMIAHRRPVIVPDTVADARWFCPPGSEYIRCWLGVPLVIQERTIGFLNLDKEQPGYYTKRHAEIAQALADQAAIAIENARLFTETQSAYEELKRAQAQLVQSEKLAAIGELAAGVAHELNNPLTTVLGFAELLLHRADPDDPHRQDLADIAEGARRARDIVRNLLSFARQSDFHQVPTDVNQMVQETLALSRRRLQKGGIAVEECYAPGLPVLRLDVGRIKQVILNLVTNALQAMPQGGTLTVTTERMGGQVAVRVADTGRGISPEHQSRVFDPFFTTKPVGQGTGLGLSVSLGIVQEHGGHIEVESREGEGSTFTVWLPISSGAPPGTAKDQGMDRAAWS